MFTIAESAVITWFIICIAPVCVFKMIFSLIFAMNCSGTSLMTIIATFCMDLRIWRKFILNIFLIMWLAWTMILMTKQVSPAVAHVSLRAMVCILTICGNIRVKHLFIPQNICMNSWCRYRAPDFTLFFC